MKGKVLPQKHMWDLILQKQKKIIFLYLPKNLVEILFEIPPLCNAVSIRDQSQQVKIER